MFQIYEVSPLCISVHPWAQRANNAIQIAPLDRNPSRHDRRQPYGKAEAYRVVGCPNLDIWTLNQLNNFVHLLILCLSKIVAAAAECFDRAI
jgi:hypothetical protein